MQVGLANGATITQSTNGSFVIDDGFNPAPNPIGQPLTSGTGFSWQNYPYPLSYGTSYDFPFTSVPNVFNSSISVSFAFQTFLMYKPDGGQWIALSEFDWSYSVFTINLLAGFNPLFSWTVLNSTQPNPSQSTPSGGQEFPSWTNDANSLRDFH